MGGGGMGVRSTDIGVVLDQNGSPFLARNEVKRMADKL